MRRIGCLLALVLAVAACVLSPQPLAARAEGETPGMYVTLRSGGSSDTELVVEKQRMREEYGLESLADFQRFFGDYIAILNGYSDDVDVLNIEEYAETDACYTVSLSTRRLDKIGGLGDIYYRLGSTYASFSDQMETLEGYYSGVRGRVTCTVYPRTDAGRTQVTHVLARADNPGYEIAAQRYADGALQTAAFEDFSAYLAGTKDRIVTFRAAQLLFAESITIRLDGKLCYVSSENIEVLDESTLRLTPREVTTSEGETIALWLGYFTYSPGLSPFAIGCICVLTAAVVGAVIFCGIRYSWFSALAGRIRGGKQRK